MTSMAYNSAAGMGGMMKEGTQHFSNQDEGLHSASVVIRNIEACLQLCQMLCTSLGPQGRSKLVVNHLGKIIVTSDCAAILKEMEVEHPAAKLLQMATEHQNQACGDGTNLVLTFAGELLWNTLELIHKMGWQHASEIVEGFHLAGKRVQNELLPNLCCGTITDVTDETQLLRILKPVLMSKNMGSQETLAPLVAQACLKVMTKSATGRNKVSPDAVRTVKIMGSSVQKSELIEGYVAQRGLETVTTSATDCKIAVFAAGVEASSTEAKGTVLMKTAEDLKSYNKTEESKMEEIIQGIAETGVKLIVSGGTVSDMALHFMDRYQLLCLKVGSKWELRRLCQATGATPLVRLGAPMAEEMGHAESVNVKEVGEKTVTVIKSSADTKLATILLRASTSSVLADLERAVEDGVRAVEMVCKDGRLVHGGGAVEMAMAVELTRQADKHPGLEQYAIRAFAKALEIVPRTLAVNAGWDNKVVANLQAAHAAHNAADGICDQGIDIETEQITSMNDNEVVDLLGTKSSALKLAVDAALTVLKIDQIIMSKPSGGPKM
ncbi:complex protein 1 subunit theta [Seminavis robusta]|uniref:Complex protein 1 subunit theta n=1 Tax=Seminavis robusta TaxID=568900 RepID=A0A9N8H8K7_9STRA|nr:complex protein 1 subunit theta [Seminavis robusta]|eukprot:Sro163_g073140.1 complex protein 1 subunit theta (551) ;mRNA; r:36569-38221